MPIVYDLIAIAAIIIMAIVGIKRGFISTLISIVKWIAALLVAGIFAGAAAGFIYDRFLEENIENKIAEYVPENPQITEFTEIDFDAIRDKLAELNIHIGEDKTEEEQETELDEVRGKIDEGETVPHAISTTYVKPLYMTLIKPVCYSIIFILVIILGILLEKIMKHTNDIPVIGGVNKFLGLLLGIVYGAAIVVLGCALLSIVMKLTNDSLPWLNSEVFEKTLLSKVLMGLSQYNG